MFNLILTFVAVFMPQVTTTLVTTGVLGDLVEELRGQSGDVLVPSDEVGAFFIQPAREERGPEGPAR